MIDREQAIRIAWDLINDDESEDWGSISDVTALVDAILALPDSRDPVVEAARVTVAHGGVVDLPSRNLSALAFAIDDLRSALAALDGER